MTMDLFSSQVQKRVLQGGARLFLGTSGYSFPDWKGVFYPRRIAGKDWLRYYALQFNSVEINSTYYRLLSENATAKMAESVPDGFSFTVKLHSSMTHSRDAGKEEWKKFHRMIGPLRKTSRMGMVLAQFPWSFPLEERSFQWLEQLACNLNGIDTAIEFRHAKWYSRETLERVWEMGFVPVSPDMPGLKNLPASGPLFPGENIYIRLHGRNSEKWWGNTQERYDYLYNESELNFWAEKLGSLSEEVKNCYVFFNNCHMGKAALNAKDMERLLQGVTEAD